VVSGKAAAMQMGTPTLGAFLSNRWYVASLTCLVLQALFWQLVLREVRLFVAYLFSGFSYFLVLIASHVIFMEHVTGANWAGVLAIIVGISLVIREDVA
jgi:drug/metabolite transporter (DMT)-like permease